MTYDDEFWIADAPIRYQVRKTRGDDLRERGVHIVRTEDHDDNAQQGILELRQDGDTLRLVQWDGDLDAKKEIEADQVYLGRNARHPFNIWRRIWKVALGG